MAENKGRPPNNTKKLQTTRREKYVKGNDKMESEVREVLKA